MADVSASVARPAGGLLVGGVFRRLRGFFSRPWLLLLIGSTIATAIMLWPFWAHLDGRILDLGDTLQQTWTIRWIQEALTTPGLSLFNPPTLYPASGALVVYQPLYTSAALGLPLYAIGWSPVAVFNALTALSFLLSCWAMSLLGHQLTRSGWAGLIAGVLYAFAHVRWGHLAHLNLLNGFWMIFLLVALIRLWERPPPTWRGRAGAALGVGGLIAAQALADVYNGLFMVALLAVWLIAGARGAPGAPAMRRPWRAQLGPLAILAVGGALAVAICAPVLLATASGAARLELQRSFDDHERFGAPLEYYRVPAHPGRLGYALPAPASPEIPLAEKTLWPGLVTLLLALVGLLAPPRDPGRRRGFLAALALVAVILSLGPTLRVAAGDAGLRSAPYRWLYDHAPLFSAARVPSRWALLAQIGLAGLAAGGAATLIRLANRLPRGWAGAALGLTLLALGGLDSARGPIERTETIVGEPLPAVYAALAEAPPGPLLEWPLANADPNLAHRYIYFTLFHRHPIVNAATSIAPPAYAALRDALAEFPNESALRLLSGLGVRYVNINRWELSGWPDLEARLAATPSLRRIGVYEADRHVLYELLPSLPPGPLALVGLVEEGGQRFLDAQVETPTWLDQGADYYAPAGPRSVAVRDAAGREGALTVTSRPVLMPGRYRWPIPAGDAPAGIRLGGRWSAVLPDPGGLARAVPDAQMLIQGLPAEVRAGETLTFRLHGKGPVNAAGAIVSLALITDAGEIVAKHDLIGGDDPPPASWPSDCFTPITGRVPVPSTVPPGQYFLAVSLYDPASNAALPFAGPDGALVQTIWRFERPVIVTAPQ